MDLFGKKTQAQLSEMQSRNESLINRIKELEAMLTPEMKEIEHLKSEISNLQMEKESVHALVVQEQTNLAHIKKEVSDRVKKVDGLKKEIIVHEDLIELESFSLYIPKYDFANSEEYKERLAANREKQKQMIKDGTAATGARSWTVNGSEAQGKKLVKDMIKLCLRSFNNECEAAVASVRFNNYDRCYQRISKSADSIEKLGKIMSVSIDYDYIQLKYDELSLALEYQTQKQKEKEELKELRAQQREEARVAKEIEDARKAAEKERIHYTKALSQLEKQLKECANETEKALLLEKEKELKDRLGIIDENMKALDYREANQRAGYVYIISNIGAFGENVYKIGMTRRLEPEDRVDELGDASVPFNFDIHAMIFSDDAPKLEAALHHAFEDRKLNIVNTRREFFNVTLDEIKEVIRKHHDKTVEFIDVPSADQYRESLKLRELNKKALCTEQKAD